MPFVLPALAFIGVSVGQALLFVASVAYQVAQAKKMKAKAAAEAEKRKGFETTKVSVVSNLPVIYGRNKIGSTVTDVTVSSNYVHANHNNYVSTDYEPTTGFLFNSSNFLTVTASGSLGSVLEDNNSKTVSGGKPSNVNEIINLASVTVGITWNGVSVYSATESNSVNKPYIATTFSGYLDQVSSIEVGTWTYYIGEKYWISDYQYKYSIRRVKTAATSTIFTEAMTASISPSEKKSEFLYTLNAISFAGISRIRDIEFDGVSVSDPKYNKGYRVHIYPNPTGASADAMSVANGGFATNYFTSTAFASCAFRLNREEAQFSGIPAVSFFVDGQKVRDINSNGTFTTTRIFSSNPALILADYLTSPLYGRGLPDSSLDLLSFYNSKLICDTTVLTNVSISGKAYGGAHTGNIPLYECNLILDTANEIRTNVELILATMGQAVLVWSGGTYKLQLAYPNSEAQVTALVDADHVFTDNDIVRQEINLTWPNAEDKLNQATVTFANAFKDFKDDSVTWPLTDPGNPSSPYAVYLQQDNQQPFKSEINLVGVTDPYHAAAKAEEMVRISRSGHSVEVTLCKRAMSLEPGDFFQLTSEIAAITSRVYRVESTAINDDLSVKVNAYYFDYTTLAWNVVDDLAYTSSKMVSKVLAPPTSVLFSPSSTTGLYGSNSGRLTWTASTSTTVVKYLVFIANDLGSGPTWQTLGETTTTSFDVIGLNNGVYGFLVQAVDGIGKKSAQVRALDVGSLDSFTIQRSTADQVAVVYADTLDSATNTQSYTLGTNTFVAYYVYSGDLPVLPIRTGITFSAFVGPTGESTRPLFLYTKTPNTTAPSSFTGTGSYTFSTDTLSGLTLTVGGSTWTRGAPGLLAGEYLWMRQAVASSTTNVDSSILITEWTEMAIVGAGGVVGSNGTRGAGWWRYDAGAADLSTVDTTAEVAVYWDALHNPDIVPVKDDRFIIATTHVSGTKAFIYDGVNWVTQANFIDGSLLVAGTVTAPAIKANSITSDKLSVTSLDAITSTIGTFQSAVTGQRVVITDNSIKVYDAQNVLRVAIGDLTGL